MIGIHRQALVAAAVLALLGASLTSVSAAPKTASGPSCGSTTIYKSPGKAWRCTFSDDFAGTTLNRSRWTVQETATSGYQNGGDCFVDSPGNVSVADGALSLTTRRESSAFTCTAPGGTYTSSHTSGMVSTWGTFAQAYGRFEVRAKFATSTVAGVQGALWLWPIDSARYGAWPASGEIDIAEVYSQYPDRAIPFIHYLSDPNDLSVTNNYCMIKDVSAFHTYTTEWTPTRIKISYDGTTCLDHAIKPIAPLEAPAPFDSPYIVALTQTLGSGANSLTQSTPLPATTVIDFVRVWS